VNAKCQSCGAEVVEPVESECLHCGGVLHRHGDPVIAGYTIPPPELPRCRLCRGIPTETTGGYAVCRSVTCPLCAIPMTVDQWQKLQGK